MKRILFRFFPVLAILCLVTGIAATFVLNLHDKVVIIGGLLAGLLGFCYFMQQQRLAEMHLFKELFTEFNLRYDKLNDALLAIENVRAPTVDQQRLIIDYFNLCAEEYLFHREGYVLPHVWQAWCRGMLQYLDSEPYSSIWREEADLGSYYGLSLEEIRRGAS
jgi:hypothetical protein